MKNLKVIGVALAGCVTFFILAVQLYVWITVYGVYSQVQTTIAEIEGDGIADPSFAPELEIAGIEESGHHKYGYVALASYSKMYDYRVVTVQSYVRLADMLDPGEAAPENIMLPAFVTARVVRFADKECQLLKATLASACTVDSSSASLGEPGYVNISMSLNFVEKGAFGVIKSDKKAAYVEINQTLTGSSGTAIVSLGGAEQYRVSIYNRAVTFCDKVRSREGNCAIFNVYINASPNGGNGGQQNVSATAVLSTITAL